MISLFIYLLYSIEGFRGCGFVDNRKDGWIWPWGRGCGCGRCSWSWWRNKGETQQSCEDSLLQQLIASVKVNKSSKWNLFPYLIDISNTSTRVSEFCNIQQQFYHYIVNKNIAKHFMKLAFPKIDMTQPTIGVPVQYDWCFNLMDSDHLEGLILSQPPHLVDCLDPCKHFPS